MVPRTEIIKLGTVQSIVEAQVIVEAEKSMPPLDLDTILFKEDGTPLGPVFDVFGSIKEPHYSIKFNNTDHMKEFEVHQGMQVYFVPDIERKLTKFAFVSELMKVPGTDASWENDQEPPEGAELELDSD